MALKCSDHFDQDQEVIDFPAFSGQRSKSVAR